MIHTPSPMPTAPIQVSNIFGDDRKLPFFAKQYNSHLGNFDSFQVPRRHTRISECKALPDMIVMKTPSSRPKWQWPPNSGTRGNDSRSFLHLGMFEHRAAKVSQHILYDVPHFKY